MIVNINYQDSNKSEYKCDKCKKLLYKGAKNDLIIEKHTYHLCIECFRKIKRWLIGSDKK